MHSTIKERCFLKGNSQEIIKKLTDKELKEVAPNIWELNSEQSIWMADMWADEKDGFMCGYRMGFQDMVENPTRFDGIPYYNSVYIRTKEGKERILCKYKEIFLFEKVDGGYEFKGVYSLDGGIDDDLIWFKRKSSLSIMI